MKYEEYYITDSKGNSNCVIRTFCKLFNKEYDCIKTELNTIAKKLKCNNYNEIEVFEKYLNDNNYYEIHVIPDKTIKEINFSKGNYVVFCYDKKDYYHMFPIIDNTYYDKKKDSIDLFVLKIYKEAII